MRNNEDLLHDAWLYDTQTDEPYYVEHDADSINTPTPDTMNRDSYTNQLLDKPDCETYTVYVMAQITGDILDYAHDVPVHGIPYFVDHAKFLAWDNPGGPTTCDVYVIPSARIPADADRITKQMMRYARYVDGYTAQPDGATTPLQVTTDLATA